MWQTTQAYFQDWHYGRHSIQLADRRTSVQPETDSLAALVDELRFDRRKVTETNWYKACVAGKHSGKTRRDQQEERKSAQELEREVRQDLVALCKSTQLSPTQRAAVGDMLARLGDPRFRADAWHLPDEPLLGFVEIPAGTFCMGTSDEFNTFWDEGPQRFVHLPPYYIARYPVTVAQFWTFVTATGYAWSGSKDSPALANHPAVWLTWYDALAYCAWLTRQLQAWVGTPEPLATLLRHQGWRAVLPSEAEWEKAARGVAGGQYPWGDSPDPNRANYDATFCVGRTSSVGCFSQGASPYGIEDMSGNIWEWTRLADSDHHSPTDEGLRHQDAPVESSGRRFLRGGSFVDGCRDILCTSRLSSYARDYNNSIGFRVALVDMTQGQTCGAREPDAGRR